MKFQNFAVAASGPSSSRQSLDDMALELLPVAVVVCDADGVIVRFNPSAVTMWGRSPGRGETARFCGAYKLFDAAGCAFADGCSPMADVLQTGLAVRDAEVMIEQPDGQRLWALMSIEPIEDEAGAIAGAVACFQDISARKLAELQLRDSEAFLRAVVEATPECVKVVARDGKLLRMNPAGLRMVEAERASLVEGRSVLDLIVPEHRDMWRAHHERICQGENLSWGFDIISLAGIRRHMESHAFPLRLPDGSIAQVAVTRDVSERQRHTDLVHDSERRYRELLEALPAPVYTTDARGQLTFYNEAAALFWGYRPELGQSQWCGSWRLFTSDGTPLPHDQCPMAIAIKEARPVRNEEAVAERPDGTRVPFLPYPTPLHDADGKLVGAVNMLVDITLHKQAQERQRLLINELNHRVKNTLATVQLIAAQTFRGQVEAAANRRFEERLIALSKTHDVLTRENWESASLHEIVAQAVEPLRGGDAARFDIDGPHLRLVPHMALALAMALHELCTNAAKYGALSNGDGKVEITWRIAQGLAQSPAGRQLRVRWREHGGPAVEPPSHKGFGSRLIERGVALELGADVRMRYVRSGLICEINAPLA